MIVDGASVGAMARSGSGIPAILSLSLDLSLKLVGFAKKRGDSNGRICVDFFYTKYSIMAQTEATASLFLLCQMPIMRHLSGPMPRALFVE